MGLDGYEIHGPVYIHHMNPMLVKDLKVFNPDVINPEYLVSVSLDTHNAIHYGDSSLIPRGLIERKPGDTKLW